MKIQTVDAGVGVDAGVRKAAGWNGGVALTDTLIAEKQHRASLWPRSDVCLGVDSLFTETAACVFAGVCVCVVFSLLLQHRAH